MRRSRFAILSLSLVVVLLAAGPAFQSAASGTPAAATPATPPLQPAQPATGPGGADLAYDGLLAQHFGPDPAAGAEPTGYWIFEPARPRAGTVPGPLPLVLLLHGFDVPTPEWHHAWIDHIVRRGAILVFPDYQAPNLPFTPDELVALDRAAPKTIATAVRAALAELADGVHATPDLTRVVVVGHSLGALLAADYAATAAGAGLPVPSALLLAMPGCPSSCSLASVGKIPATTRVVVLVGNQDTLAGEGTAKAIWAQLTQVPADHKTYVRLNGDDHGQPPLIADHFVPMTTLVYFGASVGALNALDYYGTWKFLDALMSCRFANQDCEYAFGNTPEQRFMGVWSDGVPVKEAQVLADPDARRP